MPPLFFDVELLRGLANSSVHDQKVRVSPGVGKSSVRDLQDLQTLVFTHG